jgi:esterase/lipase superfamily enzyme
LRYTLNRHWYPDSEIRNRLISGTKRISKSKGCQYSDEIQCCFAFDVRLKLDIMDRANAETTALGSVTMPKQTGPLCICLLAVLLLTGCTYSDSLRINEIRSVWGPSGHKLAPVPVFYVTDLSPTPKGGFSFAWGGVPRCGRTQVAVTDALGPPTPDPALTHIACDDDMTMMAFVEQVAEATRTRNCDRVLLIVHGYNVSFRSAMLHGAQNARDMQWHCATVLLNWSSEALFNRYANDLERSSYAIPLLALLLKDLKAQGIQTDILSHSIGVRIALVAAGALCRDHNVAINQFIMAAADISVEPRNDDMATLLALAKPCTQRYTIYASRNDLALVLSANVHGGVPRAGQLPLHDLKYEGPKVDVVDASEAPGDEAGHAYFIFSREMAKDMMWVLAGDSMAARAAAHGPHTIVCHNRETSLCSAGGGRYALRVAEARRPGLGVILLRDILAVTPIQ